MKLSHHVPREAGRLTEPVTPEYQREVDRSTDKAAVLYAAAQKRLERAELRLQRARSRAVLRAATRRDQRELAVALELVELRREELLRLERLMKASPSSVDHRGRGGFRPIPKPGGVL